MATSDDTQQEIGGEEGGESIEIERDDVGTGVEVGELDDDGGSAAGDSGTDDADDSGDVGEEGGDDVSDASAETSDGAKPPPLVNHLRRIARDLAKANRDLRRERDELASRHQAQRTTGPLPPKPDAKDYVDVDEYAKDFDKWHTAQLAFMRETAEIERTRQAQQAAAQQADERYARSRERFDSEEYEEREALVQSVLSEQKIRIIKEADDPGALVNAIGADPGRLAELAADPNLVRFTMRMAQLVQGGATSKPVKRKPMTQPEKTIARSRGPSGLDPKADRRREDYLAGKTTDATAVARQIREKQIKERLRRVS